MKVVRSTWNTTLLHLPRRFAACALSLLALIGGGVPAHASLVLVSGTPYGANFDLQYDDAALGTFGTPTIGGGSVYFNPICVTTQSLPCQVASSSNGNGLVTFSDSVAVRLIAHSGFGFASTSLITRGDYRMRGAASTVSVGGSFGAASADGSVTTSAAITPTSALVLRDGQGHDWDATSDLDFVGTGLEGATTVDLTISSLLESFTAAGTAGPKVAFVEQKFVGAELAADLVPVNPVSEPATGLLLAMAMAAFAAGRHKARS